MKRSETFKEFVTAFSKFQAEIKNPALNKSNPHLKNRYADLAGILGTVRPVLTKYGLSVYQDVSNADDKVCVTTTVYHESGEYLESSSLCIPVSKGGKLADAQMIGAGISYGKRYSLQAALGIAAEEETDGEELVDQTPLYVPSNMVNTPSDATLKAKYQLVMGSLDGYEEYIAKQRAKDRDNTHIAAALDEAKNRKTEKEPQPTN